MKYRQMIRIFSKQQYFFIMHIQLNKSTFSSLVSELDSKSETLIFLRIHV